MDAGPVITSRANARVKQLRAAFAGQPRLSGGLIAIEGEHLLQEAIRSGLPLKTIFLSETREAPAFLPRGIELLRLATDVFHSCVETQTPQGIAALLIPPRSTADDMLTRTPLILIAAGLQDPGNLGTLIRSAEAFAATGLLTTPGTVSPWNQKAIRASAGSVFRVPVAVTTPEVMQTLTRHNVRLLAAMKDDATPIAHADLRTPCALLIGNEGAGLPEEWLSMVHERITIPHPGPVESLNAAIAGSLLLYEASRQRSSDQGVEHI